MSSLFLGEEEYFKRTFLLLSSVSSKGPWISPGPTFSLQSAEEDI